MKIAIIGGTFDPPHIGHLQLAYEVYSLGKYQKIFFIPASIPAHKPKLIISPPEVRLEMLELCVDEEFLGIEKCEIERGGVSYTADTLEYCANKYGEKPTFIIGDDLLAGFYKWKDPGLIESRCYLMVARRLAGEKLDFPFRHSYLRNPILEISSSDIRRRVKESRPIRYLVDSKVEKYIYENGLYL